MDLQEHNGTNLWKLEQANDYKVNRFDVEVVEFSL